MAWTKENIEAIVSDVLSDLSMQNKGTAPQTERATKPAHTAPTPNHPQHTRTIVEGVMAELGQTDLWPQDKQRERMRTPLGGTASADSTLTNSPQHIRTIVDGVMAELGQTDLWPQDRQRERIHAPTPNTAPAVSSHLASSPQHIRAIVKEVLAEVSQAEDKQGGAPAKSSSRHWLCDTAEEAIANAKSAQKEWIGMSLEQRQALIDAMRQGARDNARMLAELAHSETGYGRVEDKVAKNNLAIEKTPGLEDLQTYAKSGDDGLTIVEGAPYGVVGSITPSTNPTSTIINNSISILAAGNAVVYNPHPGAKRSSQETMRILNESIIQAGGPATLITCPKNPTMDTSKIIMEHKDTQVLAVTGGEGVVRVAMRVGKKVVAAGPGNPPVIVDQTADLPKAGKDIVDGASFDNNVLCIAEKEIFAVDSIADALMDIMEQNGAIRVYGADIHKIMNTVLEQKEGRYLVHKNFVGREATHILKESGVSFSGRPRLIIAEVDKEHPFIMTEMLMPVVGLARVRHIREAIDAALVAEQGFLHSAYIHSTNVHNMSMAAKEMDTTIFVKNANSLAGLGFGGEGHTSLTIATPTGEGMTSAQTFVRKRRCVLKGDFRIV